MSDIFSGRVLSLTNSPNGPAQQKLTPAIKCCYAANGFHAALTWLIHLASLFSENNKSVRGGGGGGRGRAALSAQQSHSPSLRRGNN